MKFKIVLATPEEDLETVAKKIKTLLGYTDFEGWYLDEVISVYHDKQKNQQSAPTVIKEGTG